MKPDEFKSKLQKAYQSMVDTLEIMVKKKARHYVKHLKMRKKNLANGKS